MSDANRLVGPLSVAFVVGCAAWATPQSYVGSYRGFFPDLLQALLSMTIIVALAGWTIRVCVAALTARTIPWRAVALLIGSFALAEIVWRQIIGPLPNGAFKLAWLAMLFVQPALAALGLVVLAAAWMGRAPTEAPQQ